ncbi:UNVERIFIED_CONTAM: hypothetical protein HDU68_011775, partial [Siphonaria sp. JEL0065]
MGGKSDPFALVKIGGFEVARTRTINNNLNPCWEQTVYIPVLSSYFKPHASSGSIPSTAELAGDALTICLFDKNETLSDKPMGFIQSLHLSRWIKLLETNASAIPSSGSSLSETERDSLVTEWGTPYDEVGSDVWHM